MTGITETELIAIDSIDKVPLWFFVAADDEVGPAHTAKRTRNTIGDTVKFYGELRDWTHYDFGSANDDAFMELLLYELASSGASTLFT